MVYRVTFATMIIRYPLTACLLGCLLFNNLQAQDNSDRSINLYHNEANDTVVVLADTAYIRSLPAKNGQKLHLVTAGTRLVFLQQEESQKISGFSAPWARVRYINNGVAGEGYIWKGLLALGSYKRNQLQFLYGLDHSLPDKDKEMPGTWYARVKALDSSNKVLDSKTWQLASGEALSFTEGKVLGGMGLDSLQAIVRVYFSGEACAIPDDYYYFGWNGTHLLSLPGKTDISDAGVFHHTEMLLFPSEKGGQPGKIIKLIEDEEVLDEVDKQGKERTKTTRSRATYSWDGKTAIKL